MNLCNLVIDQGIFLKELKLVNMWHWFKSGDPMCFSNHTHYNQETHS